jgi:DNA invertase Pin-like site-specific DNA recombinase
MHAKNNKQQLTGKQPARAVAIIRVSTAEQALEERYSIPHQRSHIAQECGTRGLVLAHHFEFVQSGAKVLSGNSKEKEMVLQYIKDHDISVIIVHELDRLARSMLDTLLFVDQLNNLGVTFISIHDGFDTGTPQGQLQMHILAAFAEYFRKQLASKVLGGMIERAREGRHMGRRPYGYAPGEKGYAIRSDEARIVEMIFNMYLEKNMGLRTIAEHLNGMGVKTQNGLNWSHNTVKDILTNEVYTGTFIWRDIRVESSHPAIISRAAWEKALVRRQRKKELGGRAQNSFFLLSGLLKCSKCNGTALAGRTARKGKKTYRYYTCNNYASRGPKTCHSGYYRADELEKMVLEDIREMVADSAAAINIECIPSGVGICKDALVLKEKELDSLKGMLVRAAEAYERGDYEPEFFSRRKENITARHREVEGEIMALRAQIDSQLSQEEIMALMQARTQSHGNILSERNPAKIKALLQVLIDRIEVRAMNDVTIFYRG